MKYEFMAIGRVFLPLFAALIAASLVNRLLGAFGMQTPARILTVISILLMVGIAVITMVLILQRFWTNLLSSEGYLMMTLPVSTDRIILSKLFTAAVLYAASTVAVIISILVLAGTEINWADIAGAINRFFTMAPFTPAQMALIAAHALVAVALSMFAGIMMLYASMSLSMLFNKHRWLAALGAYFAISTVLQIVTTIVATIGTVSGIFERVGSYFLGSQGVGLIHIVLLTVNVVGATLCVAFYAITRYMLKNRLNLQ